MLIFKWQNLILVVKIYFNKNIIIEKLLYFIHNVIIIVILLFNIIKLKNNYEATLYLTCLYI